MEDPQTLIAGIALVVSALSFLVSGLTFVLARKDRYRDRIWTILTESPGNLRSIIALEETKREPKCPNTDTCTAGECPRCAELRRVRRQSLIRTARTLTLAGAGSLGCRLQAVPGEESDWWPQATPEAVARRAAFEAELESVMTGSLGTRLHDLVARLRRLRPGRPDAV